MSNFSKIVILIIVVLSFLFIKEKTGFDFDGFLANFKKISAVETTKNNVENFRRLKSISN